MAVPYHPGRESKRIVVSQHSVTSPVVAFVGSRQTGFWVLVRLDIVFVYLLSFVKEEDTSLRTLPSSLDEYDIYHLNHKSASMASTVGFLYEWFLG